MGFPGTQLPLLFVLAGLSGAAALGHEVLWTRRLADLVGVSADSSTRTLQCFFLGMAFGAALAARILPTVRRPLRILGGVEVGIGLLSVALLCLPNWTGWIWPALGPDRLVAWEGAMLRLGLSLLVTTPPAVLMGLALPLLTETLGRSGRGSSRAVVQLYATYTVGGGLGLVLVVGSALQLTGLNGSLLLTIAANLTVGVMCFRLDRRWTAAPPEVAQRSPPMPASRERSNTGVQAFLAFASGAGIMAGEILSLAELNLRMPLSFYAPFAVLWCVVMLLGASAAVAPRLTAWIGGPKWWLMHALGGTAIMTALAPVLFMGITAGHATIVSHGEGVVRSLGRLAGVTVLSFGPAFLLAGLVFPLLIAESEPSARSCDSARLARLLALNGVGGIAGAEVASRFLLPATGVHLALGAVGVCYGLLLIGVVLSASHRPGAASWAIAAAPLVVTIWLLGTELRKLPLFLRADTFNVVEVRSDSAGALAVVEHPGLGRALFLDNLYMLGSTAGRADLERQAHMPLLLHPAPKRVGFAGLGTGITAAGALAHAPVAQITVVEWSPLVARAAARHFAEFNRGICQEPRAKIYVEDASSYFAAAHERFDVIIGDLFVPWRPGEARLCTLEYFCAAKQALLPGGVFCQWLAMSQLTEQEFRVILATFQRAFGTAYLFRDHFKTGSTPLAVVGFRGASLDWETVARRCEAERRHGQLRDPLCRWPEGLALLYLGPCEPPDDPTAPLNSLGNLRVELAAGRHILNGSRNDYFHGLSERWLAFVDNQVKNTERRCALPAPLRRLPRCGLMVTQWEVASTGVDNGVSPLRTALRNELPKVVLTDTAADPSLWAGTLPP